MSGSEKDKTWTRSGVRLSTALSLFPLSDVGDAFQFMNHIIAERR